MSGLRRGTFAGVWCVFLLSLAATTAPTSAQVSDGAAWAFDAATTTDIMGVDADGSGRATAVANLTEVAISADLPRGLGGAGGTLFLLGAFTSGEDPGEHTGSAHAPSNLAADEEWRLLEGWYEQHFAEGRGGILAGVYAVDSEFDAKVAAEVFTNGAFGTGLDWSESGAAGPSIFPETGLGLRLRYALTSALTLRVAAVDGEPSVGSLKDRLRLSRHEGAFLISELDYQPAVAAYRRVAVGAWAYSESQERLDGLGNDDSRGLYAFWEGQLYGRPEGGPLVNGFLRLGAASEATNPFHRYASAGVSCTGLLPSRPDDLTGFGVSHGRFSQDLRDADPLRSSAETAMELTHLLQIGDHLSLQPTLQYIFDPVDAPDSDALVYGVRVGISF